MQAANRLRNVLQRGGPSFGGWQMLPGTNLSRTICRASPHLDWLVIDTEHGNISDDMMHECVAAVASCGVSPIVRVADSQHWIIKRALDAGAHGIVVPLLHTVDDAKNLVRASKFPPAGTRGFGSPFPMDKFTQRGGERPTSPADYFKQANDATLVIAQIETKSALDNADGIAAIPGIDVLFVGPFDLGNNIGKSPLVAGGYSAILEAAIEKVRVAAQSAGKSSGIYCTSDDEVKRYTAQGFAMLSVSNDVGALAKSFSKSLDSAMKS
ncbi:Phosphoenolpyruvate/pyruvate domain-containing protein [Polychaeton citri CBS 116435]|uniref:Phosphoenolpyruvate/pyruvate domain-containing protein n=1 Tax=Polychaeton citri CBS 116435 TaxID=1314669 RepID=A0A9P4US76_9PEZI|nr:Phosphoenolpyruvate/pyruvate domain-containing protein [Polychaeton citri CBS 116435]